MMSSPILVRVAVVLSPLILAANSWVAAQEPVDIRLGVGGHRIELRIRDGKVTGTVDGQVVPESSIRQEGGRWLLDAPSAGTVPAGAWASAADRLVIGVNLRDLDAALSAQLGLESSEAFVIDSVTEGMPAAKAGLRAHDVVVAIDGRGPVTQQGFRERLGSMKEGESLRMTVRRRGEDREVSVEPVKAGTWSTSSAANPFLGDSVRAGGGGWSRVPDPTSESLRGLWYSDPSATSSPDRAPPLRAIPTLEDAFRRSRSTAAPQAGEGAPPDLMERLKRLELQLERVEKALEKLGPKPR